MLSNILKKGAERLERVEEKVQEKSKQAYNRSATLQGLKEDAGRLKEVARDKYGDLRKDKGKQKYEEIKQKIKEKYPKLTDDEADIIIINTIAEKEKQKQ